MGQVLSIDQADFPVPAGAASQENADWTLGPLIVGWAGNLFLCGIVVSWASSYWSRAKGDKKVVKCAVVVAVLFECLCAIANLWVRTCALAGRGGPRADRDSPPLSPSSTTARTRIGPTTPSRA